MELKARVPAGNTMALWASTSCKEWSTSQAFNKNNKNKQGLHAGVPLSKGERAAVSAVIDTIKTRQRQDPTFQWTMENVGTGAMTTDKQVVKALGTPVIVPACGYGRRSGKTYALWMAPGTRALFLQRQVLPSSAESLCASCKANPHLPHRRVRHEQAACPQKHDNRKRISEPGQTSEGAANRIPPPLAQLVGKCMRDACEAARSNTG